MACVFNFAGKKALVTGASRGIGYGVTKALVAAGAAVTTLSREVGPLKQNLPEVNALPVDVANVPLVRETIAETGPFDYLVNCAGITRLAPVVDFNEADYDNVMQTNSKAPFFVAQAVAKGMVENNKAGAIVNLSSQGSKVGIPDHLAYCSSKGALDQATRVLAVELGKYNIRVNAVNPTVVMTEMGREAWSDPEKAGKMLERIPIGRFAEVEDVVDVVLYLLSENAAMVHGAIVPVDGGFWAT
eukprot:m.17583 g.17583  ORF g.17583 m.17583 type:complete len:244 (+) comp5491_c0_seq1:77-808(+)